MRGIVNIVSGAIGGAIAIGVSVMFFHRFLQNFPWPLSEKYIGFVIGTALGAVFGTFQWTRDRNRSSLIEVFAQVNSFRFRESFAKSDVAGGIQSASILSNWHEARNGVEGSYQGLAFQMFDLTRIIHSTSYSTEHGRTSSTSYPRQTVIIVDSLRDVSGALKIIHKRRFRKLTETIIPAMKGDRIQTAEPVDAGRQADIDRFARNYAISNTGAAIEIGIPFLRSVANGRGWSIEREGTRAIIYVERKLLPPSDYRTMLDEIKTLLTELESEKPGELVQLTPRDDVATFSTGGLMRIFIGGASGLFLSFAVFLPVFFILAETFPLVVFLWPIIGMACAIGGVFLATRIGRSTQ